MSDQQLCKEFSKPTYEWDMKEFELPRKTFGEKLKGSIIDYDLYYWKENPKVKVVFSSDTIESERYGYRFYLGLAVVITDGEAPVFLQCIRVFQRPLRAQHLLLRGCRREGRP